MKCPLLTTQLSALSVILAVLVFSPVVVFADSGLAQHGAVLETGVSNTFSAAEFEGIMTHFEMCGLGDEDLGQIYVDLTENNLLFYQIIINMTSANYSQDQATISCGQDLEAKYLASSSIEGFIFGVEADKETNAKILRDETSALQKSDAAIRLSLEALDKAAKAELSAKTAQEYSIQAKNATTSDEAYIAADLTKEQAEIAMQKAHAAADKADKSAKAAQEAAKFAQLAGTELAATAAAEAAQAALDAQEAPEIAMTAAKAAAQSHLDAMAAADALAELERIAAEPVVTEPVVEEPVVEEPVVEEPVVEKAPEQTQTPEDTESKCVLNEDGLTKKQFKKEAKNYIECLKDELKQEKKSLKESLSKKEFKEQFEILKDQFKQIKKQVEQKIKEM